MQSQTLFKQQPLSTSYDPRDYIREGVSLTSRQDKYTFQPKLAHQGALYLKRDKILQETDDKKRSQKEVPKPVRDFVTVRRTQEFYKNKQQK